ncbi:hypothetical protein [Clostridium butyricum]|uniref:hypothetical protein n=1 Tax=Clostridium butyricum TaxID=1492 RepID=UPI00325B7349
MPTTFEDVYNQFLSKIIDYDFLTISEEDYDFIMNARLKSALAKYNPRDKKHKNYISANYDLKQFDRELDELEIECLAYWLVYEWITPKVNNVEMFEHRLNTKEFQGFSEANHLKEMQAIKTEARTEAFYWKQQLGGYMPPSN